MKNKLLIVSVLVGGILAASCGDSVQRKPNKVYMPDMAYSRAYETYAQRDSNKFTTDRNNWDTGNQQRIFYNNMPVVGAVSRSEGYVYHLAKDKDGDTTNYASSHTVINPVTSLTATDSVETERLYLINCGICHGSKMDGNGPLWKDGSGPFPAKPATLVGDAKYAAMAEGTMYYSVTYGRNLMGSYASQLTPKQRWDIIYLIKQKQSAGKAAAAAPTATTASATAAKDTTKGK